MFGVMKDHIFEFALVGFVVAAGCFPFVLSRAFSGGGC
jgi:hypothetical protein